MELWDDCRACTFHLKDKVLSAEVGQDSKRGTGSSGHRCNVRNRTGLSVPELPFLGHARRALFPKQWRPACIP